MSVAGMVCMFWSFASSVVLLVVELASSAKGIVDTQRRAGAIAMAW